MNKLSFTLNSLSRLIDNLYTNIHFYSVLENINTDNNLYKHIHERLDILMIKLMSEYKRLSKKDYSPKEEFEYSIILSDDNEIIEACLQNNNGLITLYSTIMYEDILWEVLPVLAQHLTYLQTLRTKIMNYAEEIKIRVVA